MIRFGEDVVESISLESTLMVLATIVAFSVYIRLGAEESAHIGWFFLLSGFLFLGYVVKSGIDARRAKHTADRVHIVDTHTAHVSILTLALVVGVIGIEVAVRKAGGLWGDPWLIALHLCLVVSMVITFITARFFKTGLASPQRHRVLVYLFSGFYLGTIVTGTILLHAQFPLVK